MPVAEAKNYRWNVFDATKVSYWNKIYYLFSGSQVSFIFVWNFIHQIWLESDYPLIPVGRLVLDRNPTNYFQQVEQAAFTPGRMIHGVEPSPDKMLQVSFLFWKSINSWIAIFLHAVIGQISYYVDTLFINFFSHQLKKSTSILRAVYLLMAETWQKRAIRRSLFLFYVPNCTYAIETLISIVLAYEEHEPIFEFIEVYR